MGNVLYLPLKAKWYDMIESGVKREEYRDISDYWMSRICVFSKNCRYNRRCVSEKFLHRCFVPTVSQVRFSYGYTSRFMGYYILDIRIGFGRPEWGAPDDRPVLIISLGGRCDG